jgi:hypothetical protein
VKNGHTDTKQQPEHDGCRAMSAKDGDIIVPWRSPGLRPLIRKWFWSSPYRYWPVALLRQKTNILSTNYDIFVDGYPRSANTFTAIALQYCRDGGLVVSSHHHNPAAALAAIKNQMPVIILIRNPADAILSWTIFSGYPLKYNIGCYIDYYTILFPYANRVLVADFNDVTTDWPGTIDALNARYGLSLLARKLSENEQQIVSARIQEFHRTNEGGIDEAKTSWPSTARAELKSRIAGVLSSREIQPLMEEAVRVYNSFVARAKPQNEKKA